MRNYKEIEKVINDMVRELKQIEENAGSFTRDIKDFLRQEDFESALILLDDLKKYIKLISLMKKTGGIS